MLPLSGEKGVFQHPRLVTTPHDWRTTMRVEYFRIEGEAIPHADKILLRISYECAGTSCGVLRQFHILEDAVTETTEAEYHELLTSGYWTGVGPCVHPIGIVGNQKLSVDLMDAAMLRGYNPDHPKKNQSQCSTHF